MKTRDLSIITACGILAACLSLVRADTPQTSDASNGGPPPGTMQLAMPRSAGLDEVAKLTKAGVGEPVVLAYVQNSTVAYHPSADEIIRLRAEGVSDKVIAAVLQRGGEVRTEMAQTQYAPVYAPTVAQPATPAPVMVQPAQQVYAAPADQPTYAEAPVAYPDYSPSVVYVGGGYPAYPYCGVYGAPFWRPGPFFFGGGFRGPRFGGPFGHFAGPAHFGGHIGGGGFRRGR